MRPYKLTFVMDLETFVLLEPILLSIYWKQNIFT